MVDVHKTTPFRWTEPRALAALLCAEDELSDEAIADRCGVSRKTLHTWRQHPDFMAQVGDHVGQIQVAMLKHAIAKRHKRLEVLNSLHDKAITVIEERAASMISEAPGSETGLLVKQQKQIGGGQTAMLITEYAVDVGLLREIRALEEQAAKELGQWVDRTEVDQRTSVIQLVGVDAESI